MRDAVHPRLECRWVILREMARRQSKDSAYIRFVGISFFVASFRRLNSSSHHFVHVCIVPGLFIITRNDSAAERRR